MAFDMDGTQKALSLVGSTVKLLNSMSVGDSVDPKLIVVLHSFKALSRDEEFARTCGRLQDVLQDAPTVTDEAVALARWLAAQEPQVRSDVEQTFKELVELREQHRQEELKRLH